MNFYGSNCPTFTVIISPPRRYRIEFMQVEKNLSLSSGLSIKMEPIVWEEAYCVDTLLLKTEPFWKVIEINCNRECCGLRAFSFEPSVLSKYCLEFYDKNVLTYFIKLHEEISTIDFEYLYSESLNDSFRKKDFLDLMEYMIAHLCKE